MISTTSQLINIVNELQSSNTVNAAAVIRRDGVLIASNLPSNFKEKDVFAMMSATILGAAKNISTKHALGMPSRIIVETHSGNIVISDAGSKALIVCLISKGLENERIWDALNGAEEKVKDIFN
jgi:predicted regulator of Ras-like GTPase activity (Roadblock/LC7/MglB family)